MFALASTWTGGDWLVLAIVIAGVIIRYANKTFGGILVVIDFKPAAAGRRCRAGVG